jgi:hypothetical protein
MNTSIRAKKIYEKLTPLNHQLVTHPLYNNINTTSDLAIFSEHHVFAVWDFMCLLKELYKKITCVSAPWIPSKDVSSTRLISSILIDEESDRDIDGNFKSHFTMYLESMEQMGANTQAIKKLLTDLSNNSSVNEALKSHLIPPSAKEFMKNTFDFFNLSAHEVAAAFAFGREGVIELMFQPILEQLKSNNPQQNLSKIIYYLERHIELDSEDHFPKMLDMLDNLCGDDQIKWQEVENAGVKAITARKKFFDKINETIIENKTSQSIEQAA